MLLTQSSRATCLDYMLVSCQNVICVKCKFGVPVSISSAIRRNPVNKINVHTNVVVIEHTMPSSVPDPACLKLACPVSG